MARLAPPDITLAESPSLTPTIGGRFTGRGVAASPERVPRHRRRLVLGSALVAASIAGGTLASLIAADDPTAVSELPRAVPQSDAQYLDPRIPTAPALPQSDAQYLDPRIPTQP